ncbi:MAG: glycosyltransferase [Flavobacterium sp.]|nr:glycosyltransferase [Flavobacterium sp.]
MKTENSPIITVICTSYNHEKYIQQCLEGFVMQQTDFAFEIIVHDDASTDNTQKIIKKFAENYPHLFFNIYQTQNHFSKKEINIWSDIMIPKARGKYIAICEGDDYWTDPFKLQKQVDFLEANPDYGLVHSNFNFLYDNHNKLVKNRSVRDDSNFTFKSLLSGKFTIGTLTVCFVKKYYHNYIAETTPMSENWKMGDLPLWLYISNFYKTHYINEVMGVYRVLEESASQTSDVNKRYDFEDNIFLINIFFGAKYLSNDKFINDYLKCLCLYKKIIVNRQYCGQWRDFFRFFITFHAANRNIRLFALSFKQLFHKVGINVKTFILC